MIKWLKVQMLTLKLTAANQAERVAAARTLGELGHRAAVSSLLAALHNSTLETAVAAAEALGKIGDPSAIESMLRRLQSARDGLASAILQSLQTCDETEAAWQLADMALHGDEPSRLFARQYLSHFGGAAMIDALREGLKDPSREVRQRACVYLDERGWPLESLELRIEAAIGRERYEDAIAMGEEGVAAIIDLYHVRSALRPAIGECLVRAGAVEALLTMFRSDSTGSDRPRIDKQRVLELIGRVRRITTIPVLASVVANNGDDPVLRSWALSALTAMGDPAVPAMANLLGVVDPAFRADIAGRLSKPVDGRRLADSPFLDAAARQALCTTNLQRWTSIGEHQNWVKQMNAQWRHYNWLELLARLQQTEFWPIDEAELGRTLETTKAWYYKKEVRELIEVSVEEYVLTRQTAYIEELRVRAPNRLEEYTRMGERFERMPDSPERDRLRSDMWDVLKLDDQLRTAEARLERLKRVRPALKYQEERCCHEAFIPALIEQLGRPDCPARETIARVLKRINDPRAVKAIEDWER